MMIKIKMRIGTAISVGIVFLGVIILFIMEDVKKEGSFSAEDIAVERKERVEISQRYNKLALEHQPENFEENRTPSYVLKLDSNGWAWGTNSDFDENAITEVYSDKVVYYIENKKTGKNSVIREHYFTEEELEYIKSGYVVN